MAMSRKLSETARTRTTSSPRCGRWLGFVAQAEVVEAGKIVEAIGFHHG